MYSGYEVYWEYLWTLCIAVLLLRSALHVIALYFILAPVHIAGSAAVFINAQNCKVM